MSSERRKPSLSLEENNTETRKKEEVTKTKEEDLMEYAK